ncbi:hypothetical protein Vi05172_g8414 [Venturia inaequalis]|nr:hypothetical protein Vi05172_g8414 [Venturia inaequalis]
MPEHHRYTCVHRLRCGYKSPLCGTALCDSAASSILSLLQAEDFTLPNTLTRSPWILAVALQVLFATPAPLRSLLHKNWSIAREGLAQEPSSLVARLSLLHRPRQQCVNVSADSSTTVPIPAQIHELKTHILVATKLPAEGHAGINLTTTIGVATCLNPSIQRLSRARNKLSHW